VRPVDPREVLVVLAEVPAVWKNFFGTIGARSRTPASG
jgi:hypothetical protein